MMKIYPICFALTLIFLCSFIPQSTQAQTKIDSSFAFQLDPAKKFSIYIPSSYSPGTPHTLMVGLHPFNTSRWDAKSWRDTLTVFAESNGLILMCPDGGTDGKIDDAIDTAFTTALLDSMRIWYSIDDSKIYCMGFSWGAMTTYTYGLRHINTFAGFMPIGSSMGGTSSVNSVLNKGFAKPFYIIHGSSDSPTSRFFPMRDSLSNNGACVETEYMTGVGHTIDFPNRNQILTTAWEWLDSVNCMGPPLGASELLETSELKIFPNPVKKGMKITMQESHGQIDFILIRNIEGKQVMSSAPEKNNFLIEIETKELEKGIYIIAIQSKGKISHRKIVIY